MKLVLALAEKKAGFPINCIIEVTNAATNTIGTAGVASLSFFVNQLLIPSNAIHLRVDGRYVICV